MKNEICPIGVKKLEKQLKFQIYFRCVVYLCVTAASSSFLGLTKSDYLTLTSLVVSAVEGERCMDKMMCDAGKLVKKVKRAETFLR